MALARIHDLLRPGGVMRLWDVVYGFSPPEAAGRLEQWCATGRDVPPLTSVEDGWGRWEIEEHVRDEHSTYRWILEGLIERAGFSCETTEYTADGLGAKYVLRRA